jgi:hypothetical protein
MIRSVTEEVYKTYATAKHRLGSIIETPDGCRYRFALNGAGIQATGKLMQSALPISNHSENVVDVARAIGATVISATLFGATAAVADQYKDGWAHVNKGTGVGQRFRIKSHLAVAASAVITLNLYEDTPVRIALDATSEFTLVPNPFRGFLIHDSPATAKILGVTNCAVPASYYCWLQTRGPACVLGAGTLVIGNNCTASDATDGAVMPNIDFDLRPPVGHVMVVNITAEYSLIDLVIE